MNRLKKALDKKQKQKISTRNQDLENQIKLDKQCMSKENERDKHLNVGRVTHKQESSKIINTHNLTHEQTDSSATQDLVNANTKIKNHITVDIVITSERFKIFKKLSNVAAYFSYKIHQLNVDKIYLDYEKFLYLKRTAKVQVKILKKNYKKLEFIKRETGIPIRQIAALICEDFLKSE